MWRPFVLFSVLVMTVAACTSLRSQQAAQGQPQAYPPAAFAHRVGTTQVVLYWNCLRPGPDALRLDGVAQSPYFSGIRDLEFELAGVDAAERAVSQTRGAARDFVLRTNQSSPFQLDLRTTGSEVRFDLFYRYRSQQNLRSMLAGPPVGGLQLFAQATTQFLARDVCSDTQHKIPKTAR